jgi:hypothetical protein
LPVCNSPMHLDIRTVILLTSFGALMMSIGMLVTARFYPSHIQGRRRWGWACAWQALGWALAGFRGVIPDLFSIVAGNTLLIFGVALLYQAVREFQEKPFQRNITFGMVSLLPPVLLFFTYVVPDVSVRAIATSGIGSILLLMCAYSLLVDNKAPKPFTHWATGIGFLLCALVSVVRVIYLAITQSMPSLFSQNLMQDALSISVFSGVIILSFGFLLMINERFSAELGQALRDVKTLRGMLPLCTYCKKIRDDQNYWQQIDAYITEHTDAEFTHSICPGCYETVVQPQLNAFKSRC